MVSVVIPFFNIEKRAKDFIACVESVINQTYKDYEIVLVDDGSVDGTKEVVEQKILPKLEQRQIRYVYKRLDKNQGVCSARNQGIFASSGEYVAFLDFDDLFLPHHLEQSMSLFQRDSNIAWTISPGIYYLRFYCFEKAHLLSIPQFLNSISFDELIFYILINNFPAFMGISPVYKKETLIAEGVFFNEALNRHTAEDIDFGLLLLRKGCRPVFASKETVLARVYLNGVSRSQCDLIKSDHWLVHRSLWGRSRTELHKRIRSLLTPEQKNTLSKWKTYDRQTSKCQSLLRQKKILMATRFLMKNARLMSIFVRMMLALIASWGMPNLLALRSFLVSGSSLEILSFTKKFISEIESKI